MTPVPTRHPPKLPRAVLLNTTSRGLYYAGGHVVPLNAVQAPYFYAVPDHGTARDLQDRLRQAQVAGQGAWRHVLDVGDVVRLASYWNPGHRVEAVPVYVRDEAKVDVVSSHACRELVCWSLEHDVSHVEQVLIDQAAAGRAWILDTRGRPAFLRVLYLHAAFHDGEPTALQWSVEDLGIQSRADLAGDDFQFRFTVPPGHAATAWRGASRLEARETACRLGALVRDLRQADLVVCHAGLHEVLPRLAACLGRLAHDPEADDAAREAVQALLEERVRSWSTFTAGRRRDAVTFLPAVVDTSLAAAFFDADLQDADLRAVAHALHLDADQDVADVLRDVGRQLLVQVLPLAFLANLGPEELLTSGNVRIWDHMSHIRCRDAGKLFPARCQPKRLLTTLEAHGKQRSLGVARRWRRRRGEASIGEREAWRVLRQGSEAPEWLDYRQALLEAGRLEYEVPGGYTVRPQDVDADWVPFQGVVEADVGAMYPVLVRGLNASPDAVHLAWRGEDVQAWAWLPRGAQGLREAGAVVRRATGDDGVPVDQGSMVGLRINPEPGGTVRAMAGVLALTLRVRAERDAAPDDGAAALLGRLYAGLKVLRNAGTHGILSAANASCRQFHPLAAAWITTTGQRILRDAVERLNQEHFVFSADTDGVLVAPNKDAAIEVEQVVQQINHDWQGRLAAPDFAFELSRHDAAVAPVHKHLASLRIRCTGAVVALKGSNFLGRDKPPIARRTLHSVLAGALQDAHAWLPSCTSREEARQRLRAALAARAARVGVRVADAALADLVLTQRIRPAHAYRKDPCTDNIHPRRVRALEALRDGIFQSDERVEFVVARQALPGFEGAQKTRRLPLAYLWPLECLRREDVDEAWYEAMVRDVVASTLRAPDAIEPRRRVLEHLV